MYQTIANLPPYLRRFCVEQSQVKYTARDHASWRFIMRQSRSFFRDHGVPIYLEGLKKTGITVERIPLISEMDKSLRQLGWGAVPVCGFIPPAAFLDFQARRILPIAADMRSPDHIHYTPAPDIVHEAAGHAPIIADPDYSDYLTKYAAMAQKAIFCAEDLDQYEAIRSLSDIKENPDSTLAMIQAAEAKLTATVAATTFISEAAKVARMNWWTVEYGLLGSLENPKIYGAGLLSSVGESQNCLKPKVRKIRLTTACVETSYDITEPQPQLFVAEDIKHLSDVLSEYEQTLAFHRGGSYGLDQALKGRTVTTTVLDSGLEISGKLIEFKQSANGDIEFLKYEGPVQLAHQSQEIADQGIKQHPHGFSSPLGRFKGQLDKPACRLTDSELKSMKLVRGERARLELNTGFVIEGEVVSLTRLENLDNLLSSIKWRDCRVTRQNQVYFEPAWGDFDMAVGETVTSVFGGPADRESYGSHEVGQAVTSPGRKTPFTEQELKAFAAYQELRDIRSELKNVPGPSASSALHQRLTALTEKARREFPDEWLLRLECLELAYQIKTLNPDAQKSDLLAEAERQEKSNNKEKASVGWLIRQGVQLATHTTTTE